MFGVGDRSIEVVEFVLDADGVEDSGSVRCDSVRRASRFFAGKVFGFDEKGKLKSKTKGLERIAKTPIKMFKAKGATKPNTAKSNASSGAKAMPPKPSIF